MRCAVRVSTRWVRVDSGASRWSWWSRVKEEWNECWSRRRDEWKVERSENREDYVDVIVSRF